MYNINDISKSDSEASRLSTFKEYPFTLDGVSCRTMESFLQSLREQDVDKQVEICSLVARDARENFATPEWVSPEPLYWQGEKIDRESHEYNKLIARAYDAMFNNKKFNLLLKSLDKDAIIINSYAQKNELKTLLTEDEQCNYITVLQATFYEPENSPNF